VGQRDLRPPQPHLCRGAIERSRKRSRGASCRQRAPSAFRTGGTLSLPLQPPCDLGEPNPEEFIRRSVAERHSIGLRAESFLGGGGRVPSPFDPATGRGCQPDPPGPGSSGASSGRYTSGGGCIGGSRSSRIIWINSSALRRRSSSDKSAQSDLMSMVCFSPHCCGWRRLMWNWRASMRSLERKTSSLLGTRAPFLAVTQSLVPSSAMSRICSPNV
jgi:hypothetical protein